MCLARDSLALPGLDPAASCLLVIWQKTLKYISMQVYMISDFEISILNFENVDTQES
jgi:hypothetical protein